MVFFIIYWYIHVSCLFVVSFFSVWEKRSKWRNCFVILWRSLLRMLIRNIFSSEPLIVFFITVRFLLPLALFVEFLFQCRFPFIASEIFTCEVDIILRTLVEDVEVVTSINSFSCFCFISILILCFILAIQLTELATVFFFLQLMDLLFSFIKPDRRHSTLLAGYFSKVKFNFLFVWVNYHISINLLHLYVFFSFYFWLPSINTYVVLLGCDMPDDQEDRFVHQLYSGMWCNSIDPALAEIFYFIKALLHPFCHFFTLMYFKFLYWKHN